MRLLLIFVDSLSHAKVKKGMLLDALQTYNASAGARTDEHKKYLINAQFGVAMSLYHALGLLKNHGMKSCYSFLKTFSEKEFKEKVRLI